MSDDFPHLTPEQRARIYDQFIEQNFERVHFHPRPIEFMPAWNASIGVIVRTRPGRILLIGVGLYACVAVLLSMINPMLSEMPRPNHFIARIAAGAFLVGVIINFVIECGWNCRKPDR